VRGRRRDRRLRADLLVFCDCVALFLEAGWDLAYAWDRALEPIDLAPESRAWLGEPGSVSARLERLSREYPVWEHRLWFSVLGGLHSGGAPLLPAVAAMGATLRGEVERDLESFARELPTRVGALVVLFYYPAAALLLFVPLLLSLFGGR